LKSGESNSRLAQLQYNQSKMDWRHGSSTRAPALKVQSPDFKTPVLPPQKKERKRNTDIFHMVLIDDSVLIFLLFLLVLVPPIHSFT
jgi:hypothetical protein